MTYQLDPVKWLAARERRGEGGREGPWVGGIMGEPDPNQCGQHCHWDHIHIQQPVIVLDKIYIYIYIRIHIPYIRKCVCMYICIYIYIYVVSGRFSCITHSYPEVNDGNDLVETWEKALVIIGYTYYHQHQ